MLLSCTVKLWMLRFVQILIKQILQNWDIWIDHYSWVSGIFLSCSLSGVGFLTCFTCRYSSTYQPNISHHHASHSKTYQSSHNSTYQSHIHSSQKSYLCVASKYTQKEKKESGLMSEVCYTRFYFGEKNCVFFRF